MKPGVARWALQQSVSLSPIKLICPAPCECTLPTFSFLGEIALALNSTNLNIFQLPVFPAASLIVQISQRIAPECWLCSGVIILLMNVAWTEVAAGFVSSALIHWRRKSLNVAINLADQHKILLWHKVSFSTPSRHSHLEAYQALNLTADGWL